MDQQRGLTAYHDSFAIATVINEVSFQRQDKADLYYEQEQRVSLRITHNTILWCEATFSYDNTIKAERRITLNLCSLRRERERSGLCYLEDIGASFCV